jgi:acetyltransferase-like isoleucine patch superfamily enzyme
MKTIWISGTIFNYEDLSELTNALQNAHCQLGNHAMLGDCVRIGNGVRIGDWVWLGDCVRIGNGVRIGNHAMLGDGVRLGKSPLYITSDLPYLFNGYNDRIQIGCKDFTVAEWKESYEDIAERSGETNENVIQKYYKLICLYDEWRCK